MDGRNQQSESIGVGMVYRYVGLGYVVGIPARDLTEADLAELAEREGITRKQVEATGIYEPVEYVEVQPFCSEPDCEAAVANWGDKCSKHLEVINDDA